MELLQLSARYVTLLIFNIIRPIPQRIMVAVSVQMCELSGLFLRDEKYLPRRFENPVSVIWQVLKARTRDGIKCRRSHL